MAATSGMYMSDPHGMTSMQQQVNHQSMWVEYNAILSTHLQLLKLPGSHKTVIVVEDKQMLPVAHQLWHSGVSVLPHPGYDSEQYIHKYALSHFCQGPYQVLVTTLVNHCPRSFEGIATQVIVNCDLSVNQYWECTKLLGPQGGTITTYVSYANWNMAFENYPTGWYNQAYTVPQEQSPQSTDTRQMVSATQPNGQAFTSCGKKVLCKSASSPLVSFTPVGQHRSMNKSLVPQDRHSHKPQLPLPKVPSQYQASPEDILGSLPNNQTNPGSLLHGESPCPQPKIGKVTDLANNWVPKPTLVPCVSFDPLEEEMPHLH